MGYEGFGPWAKLSSQPMRACFLTWFLSVQLLQNTGYQQRPDCTVPDGLRDQYSGLAPLALPVVNVHTYLCDVID
jgi:hypothetical protein